MNTEQPSNLKEKAPCCSVAKRSAPGALAAQAFAKPAGQADRGPEDAACCGQKPAPESDPMARPGYRIMPFVEGFAQTAAGPVPRVAARLAFGDKLAGLWARLGPGRKDFTVAPGLYCVGRPDQDSPVLLTANYGLTFNALRRELEGLNLWLLVLDTRGVNVWCAAGKGTFSTQEAARRMDLARLKEVVAHREVILPQLSATGVSARALEKASGFRAVWGPVRAKDIRAFLEAGKAATPAMRRVEFPLAERVKLVPVELYHLRRPLPVVLAATFLASGIGSGIFSLAAAWQRGLVASAACLAGILAGAVLAPLLLPWLPGRALAFKGAIAGLAAGGATAALLCRNMPWPAWAGVLLLATVTASFLAMNFTGATPYTSPSGVEKEMRRAIPAQALGLALAAGAWIAAGFIAP